MTFFWFIVVIRPVTQLLAEPLASSSNYFLKFNENLLNNSRSLKTSWNPLKFCLYVSNTVKSFEISWDLLNPFSIFWKPLKSFAQSCILVKFREILRNYWQFLEISWNLLICSLFLNTLTFLETPWNFLKFLKLSWNSFSILWNSMRYLEILSIFGNFLKYFEAACQLQKPV